MKIVFGKDHKEGVRKIQKTNEIDSQELARMILGCLVEGKADNVKTLDVASATILADYFIIATVGSNRQAKAIAVAVHNQLKQRGIQLVGQEGREEGWWVLMDFGAVVLHVMQQEARSFYDLDNYWGESPEVELEPIRPLNAAG